MRYLLAALAVLLLIGCAPGVPPGFRSITIAELRDRIEGGWAGQMIGVSYGAPTEFLFNQRIIPEEKLPQWSPEKVSNSLDQDDLYVDMTFAKVLDEKGLDATTEDFGAMLKEAKYRLWHANLAARRALRRGVSARLSGTPAYNVHANDIDFQIEADFVGLMAPGLPQAGNDLCLRAGRVMNTGDGIYGGMFVSGMYSAAFFESDPRNVVQAGWAAMPAESPYGKTIADVLAWHKQYPNDWIKVWHLIEEKWNKREPCPNGALRPFNIDAKLNGAYIALGLLYGGGDFERTLIVSTRAGQDSDCNPANACGILGVMRGYKSIPEKWKAGIPGIANRKFSYTDFTFRGIVDSTEKRAVALVERNGGRREGDRLLVKVQEPKAPPLEIWDDYGSPTAVVPVDDAAWKWRGGWLRNEYKDRRGNQYVSRIAATKGAEAEVWFDGTGVIVVGPYLPTGGKADVYLDGKLHRTVDVFPDEAERRVSEAVWHAFRLPTGKHNVRIVVRGEPYEGSNGTEVALEQLIVFR